MCGLVSKEGVLREHDSEDRGDDQFVPGAAEKGEGDAGRGQDRGDQDEHPDVEQPSTPQEARRFNGREQARELRGWLAEPTRTGSDDADLRRRHGRLGRTIVRGGQR